MVSADHTTELDTHAASAAQAITLAERFIALLRDTFPPTSCSSRIAAVGCAALDLAIVFRLIVAVTTTPRTAHFHDARP
jgi:hypothetical protein